MNKKDNIIQSTKGETLQSNDSNRLSSSTSSPVTKATATSSLSSSNNFMKFNYKTPQQELMDALNFETNQRENIGNVTEADITSDVATRNKLKQFLQRMNNNVYLYPGISILVLLIVIVVILFQKNVSILIKVFLVIIFLVFLIFTIYQFKYQIPTT